MALADLYLEARQCPFPRLGRIIGDFVLYDSLLMGVVSCRIAGDHVKALDIPVPDEESLAAAENLRAKSNVTPDEAEFLAYYAMLERLRESLRQDA